MGKPAEGDCRRVTCEAETARPWGRCVACAGLVNLRRWTGTASSPGGFVLSNREAAGMVLEPKPGTYALILSCSTNIRVQIGRLGTMRLQPGYYVYLGSALGSGGLRARIAHHQKPSLRPHWHIDYLRAHTRFHCIWFSYDARRREHQWARVMRTVRSAMAPLLGFGAPTAIVGRIFTSSSVARHGPASSEHWNLWPSDTLRWKSSSAASGVR